MKIWNNKRKRSQKQAAEAKDFLLELLRPYTWTPHPTAEENAQAAEVLRQILVYLRELPPGHRTVPIPEMGRCQLDYLIPLMATEEKLRSGDCWNACNELMNLVYFYPVLRPGIRQNVIGLLAEYLEG